MLILVFVCTRFRLSCVLYIHVCYIFVFSYLRGTVSSYVCVSRARNSFVMMLSEILTYDEASTKLKRLVSGRGPRILVTCKAMGWNNRW